MNTIEHKYKTPADSLRAMDAGTRLAYERLAGCIVRGEDPEVFAVSLDTADRERFLAVVKCMRDTRANIVRMLGKLRETGR